MRDLQIFEFSASVPCREGKRTLRKLNTARHSDPIVNKRFKDVTM